MPFRRLGIGITVVLLCLLAAAASATTTLLSEGFESAVPPAGWTQAGYPGDDFNPNWVQQNGDHKNTGAHGGTYDAMLFYALNAHQRTYLITPAISFGAHTLNPTLTFWLQQNTSGSYTPPNYQDTLTVCYRTSAGGSWTTLASYTSKIATWTKETVSLPNVCNTYYIGFLGDAHYGLGVCIDDVSVTADAPAPSAPNLTALPQYTKGISCTVSWSAVSGATGYYVEWSTSSAFATIAGNSGWISATSYTATGLTDGTKYYYHVKAQGDGGTSAYSGSVNSTQDASPPTSCAIAPTSLQTAASFAVTWTQSDAGSGVALTHLYYNHNGGAYAEYGAGFGGLSAAFNCPNGDGIYGFYTCAVDAVGNVEAAPASADLTVTVDTTAPTSSAGPLDPYYASWVVNVPYTAVDGGGVGVAYVNLYYRRRSTTGGTWGAWTAYTAGGSANFTSSPIAFDSRTTGGNGEYGFYARAVDLAGNAEVKTPAAECSTKIIGGGLTAPTMTPEPTYTAGASTTVSWTGIPADATCSQAQCSADPAFATGVLDSGWLATPTAAYTFSGLVDGTKYYYRARAGCDLTPATNSPAVSPWSNTVWSIQDTPTPSITSLDPPSRPFDTGAFTLTITGAGFLDNSVVRWNGSDRPTHLVSSTQVTADIPASDIATAGTAAVTVVNTGPLTSNAVSLGITASACALTYTGDSADAYGAPVNISARLTSGGLGVAGINVGFTVSDKAGKCAEFSVSATTDTNGNATVQVPANRLSAGSYQVCCYVGAGKGYLSAQTTGALTVTPAASADSAKVECASGVFLRAPVPCPIKFSYSGPSGAGYLSYLDNLAPRTQILATANATSTTVTADTARIVGPCTVNGVNATFTLIVTSSAKSFTLTTSNGYSSGTKPITLSSGSIQITLLH
jgi:hypothetical protein